MITLELDSCRQTAAGFPDAQAMDALERLLDRCEAENLRDIVLRIPALAPKNLEEFFRPILDRPFRFLAWFRVPPPLAVADLVVAKGHRIILAATAAPGGHTLHSLLMNPVCAVGHPWSVSLFIALPVPVPDLWDGLDRTLPRYGTNVTLGLAWASPESGPSPIPSLEEQAWAQAVVQMTRAGTGRGITFQFACGLPLCLFSTEQLGQLALSRIRHPLASCVPGLMLTLDNRARACPQLPAGGWVPVPAGVPLKDLSAQLIGSAICFGAFCGRPGEHSCRSLATGACGGGCLAQNTRAWHGNPSGT